MGQPRILIVGGGIGGLTLAASLSQRAIASDLIERTAAWAPVGAGITLGINAMKILKTLGLQDRAIACGRPVAYAAITDAAGRELSALDLGQALRDYGVSIAIHRADLHAVLVSGCERAAIRMGTTLRSVEPRESGVRVTFSDASQAEYDLVVGADGIRSQVRDLVFGPLVPRYSGYACWRFIVRTAAPVTGTYEMWGRGRRFGIVPLPGNDVYAFATINTPAASERFASIGVADFRRLFSDFGGPARPVLDALTPETKLIYGDLAEIVQPRWITDRVALLGDAAHAMTPNLGQGAAMAMEDAAVLAKLIAKGRPMPQTLQDYEERRRPRAERVQRTSRRQGRLSQAENPALCALRNLLVRLTPESVPLGAIKRLLLEEI